MIPPGLSAWTVIVARDDAPGDDISLALRAAGAQVVPLALMHTEALEFAFPAGPFDVVAFASSNAVDAVLPGSWLHPGTATQVAAVGKVTAARLRERGVDVDVVGDAGGAALALLLIAAGVRGARVLLPRSQQGNDDLKLLLQEAGAVVVAVDVTRSVAVDMDVDAVLRATVAPRALLLTSPRRAEVLLQRTKLPADVVVIAIGATTAAALRALGQRVDVVPARPDPEAVVEALLEATRAAEVS